MYKELLDFNDISTAYIYTPIPDPEKVAKETAKSQEEP